MQRLKTRSQFQAALAGGTVARTNHFALHCVLLPIALNSQKVIEAEQPSRVAVSLFSAYGVWMGAMVPKRWAKRAVTRNAIKRQIYNVSQEFEAALPMAAHVVRLRSGFDKTHFISATSDALKAEVNQELRQLFTRAVASAELRIEAKK
ncbi:MAG: ribonuclease P protein component [Rhodoferax sp.]|nr:ribonuclease P protein component [Rhodoferax sp.]